MLGPGVDVAAVRFNGPALTQAFHVNTFNADNGFGNSWWISLYDWIGQANVIIERASSEDVKWPSEADKNQIIGEARFLRAFAYNFLANIWGGVPLVLQETTGPKFDYHRTSQDSVYQQCKEDLVFAIQWMKTVDQLPGGRAHRDAAYTLLRSEERRVGKECVSTCSTGWGT